MKILSLDAEVNGLYGVAFAIGAVIRDGGTEVARFSGRCSDNFVTDGWVRENVLPKIADMPIDHTSSESLEEAFWKWWESNKDGCTVIAHCGSPVESGLFRRCVERDVATRAFSGPYPALHDVATLLLIRGHDPSSVDGFLRAKSIDVPFNGASHHPLYDAIAAAVAWEALV